jgi:hypothetical protein
MIRIILPPHLRNLAGVSSELKLKIDGPVTQKTILDAIENQYPVLKGTIRDQQTKKRRPMLRFFACKKDLSHESADAAVPDEVADGREPYIILGAIAGG